MDSYLDKIFNINNIQEFFNNNENNIYIFNTIGIQDFDEDDNLGKQLKNLQLEYKFNVNETLIFRTFCSQDIIIYVPMDNLLYYLKFNKPVLNSFILFNNIILFYIKNNIQIVDIKNFKTKNYKINNFSLELIYTYSEKFKNDNEKKDIILENLYNNINLQSSNVYNNIENFILINGNNLKCEKIWSIFSIQKKNCYCISIIYNKIRTFKYIINFSNNTEKIFSLSEFINFLNENFYIPLKNRIFLY